MPGFEKLSKGRDGNVDNFNPKEKTEDNLWVSILGEVLASSQNKLPTSKQLLVLGDNESGKTTLIAKGQGTEAKKGTALEYLYINVKDEYGEDQTRLGAWILDGDLHHRGLLKFALTEQSFEHCTVLLVASLEKPWDIMDVLQRWGEVLTTHVQRLKLDPNYRKERQDALYRHFQEYQEPEEGQPAPSQSRRGQSVSDISDVILLPLGDNILTENLGLPIVVVLTKSDAMTELEKNNDYQLEHWDFIQQHVRKFCLKFGASLFYTSSKENKNISLLFKYLNHLIYNFPFNEPACVVEKDSVFIPAGWDSEKKVSILYEGLTSMKHTDKFNDIIRAPLIRNQVQREVEVMADEEQLFLMKLQTQLTKQPVDSSAQRASPGRTTPTTANVLPTKVSPSRGTPTNLASPVTSQAKKPEARVSSATSDTGVLANFFNSLLSKKTADGKSGTDRQVSVDANQSAESTN
ncbi:hypothetical protein HELRODRAFT_185640 [Helobdella robusta]|uniref:Dynein light intermediate chain n=1 Tax=Helobdella robusta TaxID=6412 RepID=T1FN28_HELRO|nr:hypothetical protein HELRODRAFT_185640 [Helobdella robusta]ESO03306.1 hypothetical protein HELRODRAFT_185640 [Helobdella robusta]